MCAVCSTTVTRLSTDCYECNGPGLVKELSSHFSPFFAFTAQCSFGCPFQLLVVYSEAILPGVEYVDNRYIAFGKCAHCPSKPGGTFCGLLGQTVVGVVL